MADGGGALCKNNNKLIIGDNYPALLNLLIQYRNKINIIYIDPPYGKNNIGEFAKTNYENNISRETLLSMLYPRLILAKQLLTDDGVIFCSIDDRNQAYVKGLFDEVFGEENFLCNFPRKTKTKTGDEKAGLNIQHDYVLAYAKYRKEAFLYGEKKSFDKYQNPDNDINGEWAYADPSAKSGGPSTYFPIENPFTKELIFPPKGRYWAFSKKTLNEYIESGRIVFKSTYKAGERGFIFKRYKSNLTSRYDALDSLSLLENKYNNSEGTIELNRIFSEGLQSSFINPKPVSLIKKLVASYHKKDAIILDFFAGSGTTGQAVLELNKEDYGSRQFILCTNNEITDSNPHGIAIDVTSKRLKRVMTGSCYDGNADYKWNEKNEPLGEALDVYEIKEVTNFESSEGKTPFDVIDETIYGEEKFDSIREKIEWVCKNFENTQKYLERIKS